MSVLIFAAGLVIYAVIVGCMTDSLDVGSGRIGKWSRQDLSPVRERNWNFKVNKYTTGARELPFIC